MTDANFAILIDFAAGGLTAGRGRSSCGAATCAPSCGCWPGRALALAAIPIVRGLHDSDTALVAVGVAVLVLRAAVLPWLLARALAAEQRGAA